MSPSLAALFPRRSRRTRISPGPEGTVRVHAPDLSGDTAARLREHALGLVDAGQHALVVDLTGVEQTDGDGAAALLAIAKRVEREGGTLTLTGVDSGQPYARFRASGLPSLPAVAFEEALPADRRSTD